MNETPKNQPSQILVTPKSQSSQTPARKSKQTLIQTQPQYVLHSVFIKKGKSVEMSTFGEHYNWDNILEIITVDWINLRIYHNYTPLTIPAYEIKYEITEVEKSISKLLAEGIIDEKYVVDYFTQEALFESKKYELREKYAEQMILICGGEIFVGNNFEELEKQAQMKYSNRPFYSHSFRTEYSMF